MTDNTQLSLISHTEKQIINAPKGIHQLQPFKFPRAWTFYTNANKNHWTPLNTSMTPDVESLAKLKEYAASENNQSGFYYAYCNTLANLSTSDILALDFVEKGINDKIDSPEHKMYLSRQQYEESLHCYADGTEVLTPNGWSTFNTLTIDSAIVQYDNGTIRYSLPLGITKDPYEGDMIEFLTEGVVTSVVTPNHNTYVVDKDTGKGFFVEARYFVNQEDVDKGIDKLIEDLTALPYKSVLRINDAYGNCGLSTDAEGVNNIITLFKELPRILEERPDANAEMLLKETVLNGLYVCDNYVYPCSGEMTDNKNIEVKELDNFTKLNIHYIINNGTIEVVTEKALDDKEILRYTITSEKHSAEIASIVEALFKDNEFSDTLYDMHYNAEANTVVISADKEFYLKGRIERIDLTASRERRRLYLDYFIEYGQDSDGWTEITENVDINIGFLELMAIQTKRKVFEEKTDKGIRIKLDKKDYYTEKRTCRRITGYKGHVWSVGVDSRVIVTRYNNHITICGNTWTYNVCVDSLNLDPADIYTRYQRNPTINAKAEFTKKILGEIAHPLFKLDSDENIRIFIKAYIFLALIFEGTWFYNGFNVVFALNRLGYMKQTGQQFQYILRDEVLHTAFGSYTIEGIMKRYPNAIPSQEEITDLFNEAMALEEAYIKDTLSKPIFDYSAETHIRACKHTANRRLVKIGYAPIYEGVDENPVPWLGRLVNASKEKNFFETVVTEYTSAPELKGDDDDY